MNENKDIRVGKLGRLQFRGGYYAYVGSARGSGGEKRVIRHFNLAHRKDAPRKWHIDYLLAHSEVICAVFSETNDDLECTVAKIIGEFSEGIKGFGCTDCSCKSHLFFTGKNIIWEAAEACEGISGNESIIIYPHM